MQERDNSTQNKIKQANEKPIENTTQSAVRRSGRHTSIRTSVTGAQRADRRHAHRRLAVIGHRRGRRHVPDRGFDGAAGGHLAVVRASAALSDRKRLARPPPPPPPPLHWGCPSLKAIHRLWDQDSAERASPPAPAVRGGGGPAAGSGSVSGSSRRGRSGGSRSPGVWEVMGALRARAARGLAPAPMGISGEPSEEVGDEEKDEEQGSRGRLSVGGGGEGRSATDRRRVEQSEV